MPREKAVELYKKLGFGYLINCLEDCADNDWVGNAFAKFKEDSGRVYKEQFEQENIAMTTPEIDRLISQLGYIPKFVSFGSEIIRRWSAGVYSENLNRDVVKALQETEKSSENCRSEIPDIYSKEGERLKKAKERFRIIYEEILPEFDKLVKMDIDEEKLRQLADEMAKQGEAGGEKGGTEGLPPELKEELREKIEENLREQLEKISEEIDKLKEEMEKAGSSEEKEKIAEKIKDLLEENEELENGERIVVPWDKLSDDLKNKLKEIFDKLPREAKKKLEEGAREALERLDDKLIEEMRGKLAEDASPPTHEEIKIAEEKIEADRLAEEERAKLRKKGEVGNEELTKNLRKTIEGDLGEYDLVYKEIALLADKLYNRIHKIFLPKRHPRWEKGKQAGQWADLAKVMQFQADRSLYDKLWETRTIPKKIDYKFTLLVDLSGSMRGEKIEQTFRGVILLTEVLNRLGIKTQILGFQDELIFYKDFGEELTPEIRKKMAVMRKEVYNQGKHNQADWNSDGFCLEQASKLLARQKGKDSFLVVLSDGLPAPDLSHAGEEYDLKEIVEKIRKHTRQKLIGVGLGQGTEHVSDYYPTSLPNLDIRQLVEMLGDLLEDMIGYPSKYV
jgi:nitric oxide reductase activation protein